MQYTRITQALVCAALVAGARPCLSATATPTLTPTITPGEACPNVDLGTAFPITISGSTVGHLNRINPSCGLSRASEVVYRWTAPAPGLFQIDTIGSTFDTVLHVADGASCFGPALPGGCNDDSGGNRWSLVTVALRQGQTVLVVVDGYSSNSGSFTLHISTAPTPTPTPTVTPTATRTPTPSVTPVATCPDVSLGNALPIAVTGSTVGYPNRIDPACRPSTASEVVYEWTAPVAGLFQMDTIGSMFDTVLHVYDGASCFGPPLPGGCNDDGGGERSSLVTVSLSQGQKVLVVVDGYTGRSGSFTLHISTAPTPTPTPTRTSTPTRRPTVTATSAVQTMTPSAPPTPTATLASPCPEVDLGSALPVALNGSTAGHPNRINPSCALSKASEVVYKWTAPAAGLFQMDTIGSTFDTVLQVDDGASCFGPALPGACNDDGGGNRSSLVTVSLRQGQTVVIVVDGYDSASGPFVLHVSTAPTPTPTSSVTPTGTRTPTPTVTPVPTCPDVNLGNTLPIAVSGSTVGHPNRINPSCRASTASELVYQWTAPVAGLFQMDTIGSTFDTVLHVYDGASCFGPALPGGCNDDGGGNRTSLVAVSLNQGQTVLVVVDGYNAGGSFTLHISAAPTPSPTPTRTLTPTRRPTVTATSATQTMTPSAPPSPTATLSICPEGDLGSALPVAFNGSTVGHPNRINPPCALSKAGEAVYKWTAPAAGLFRIDTVGSTFDTVLLVDDGASCFGPVLPGGCNDDGGGNRSSRVTVSLQHGQTVLIVVDGYDAAGGSFVLHISTAPTPTPTSSVTPTATRTPTPTVTPVPTCPDVNLGNSLPVAVSGSTVGYPNRINPSCRPSTASEVVYEWTAPVAGLFQMDTIGSTFDTVLHVYDGASCFGPALPGGCNDDGGGNRSSLVTVSLGQGQTVLVVVDGYTSRSGFFSLHIAPVATPTATHAASM